MNPQQNPTALTPANTPTSDTVPAAAPADPAPDIGALLKKAEDEAAELKDAWLRARADVENVRKQGANDVAGAHKFAIEKFAGDLLQVKDALESTLAAKDAAPEALRDGVALTLKQLAAAFDKAQVSEIDPAGQKFDPHQHMAMTAVEHGRPGLPERLSPAGPRAATRAGGRGQGLRRQFMKFRATA